MFVATPDWVHTQSVWENTQFSERRTVFIDEILQSRQGASQHPNNYEWHGNLERNPHLYPSAHLFVHCWKQPKDSFNGSDGRQLIRKSLFWFVSVAISWVSCPEYQAFSNKWTAQRCWIWWTRSIDLTRTCRCRTCFLHPNVHFWNGIFGFL